MYELDELRKRIADLEAGLALAYKAIYGLTAECHRLGGGPGAGMPPTRLHVVQGPPIAIRADYGESVPFTDGNGFAIGVKADDKGFVTFMFTPRRSK